MSPPMMSRRSCPTCFAIACCSATRPRPPASTRIESSPACWSGWPWPDADMRPRRSTLDRPLSGAHCDLADLLGLRAWAGRLQGSVRGAVARTDGRHPARGRGRGLDFEEVRPYQPGDDVRSIDWRVTARSQQPYSRVYHTERERPVLLVVDQRPTMFFGSRHCCKSVLAAQLAAWLAWAALGQGDRVGALVLTSGAPVILPPRRSRRSVLQLLEATARANQALSATLPPAPAAALEQALATLPGLARSGASLWLLSDLTGLEQGQSLQQLRQQIGRASCRDRGLVSVVQEPKIRIGLETES